MMSLMGRLGWRFHVHALACVCLAAGVLLPRWPFSQSVYRYLFIVDISQSMNARDYRVEGYPADRLGFVKASIKQALYDLPCGSEVGLGVFVTQTTQILFEPVEICEHFPSISDALEHIDWRMAWAADSHIAQGLFAAIRELAGRADNTRLVFVSDGEQFPPGIEIPYFHYADAKIRGFVVGAGGSLPVPIPRLDRENHPQGFWEYADMRDFLPPSAPWPKPGESNFYLSHLDEAHLRALASITSLTYHRLETAEGLTRALSDPELAEPRGVIVDVRPGIALLALLLFLSTYWPYFARLRRTGKGL